MSLETVAHIERHWEAVKRELIDHADLMAGFVSSGGGLSREHGSPVGTTSSRTGTSFAVHTLMTCDLFDTVFSVPQRSAIFDFIRTTLCTAAGPIPSHGAPASAGKPPSLNEYSVPIWLSAIFAACGHPESDTLTSTVGASTGVHEAVRSLTALMQTSGSLSRVVWGARDSSPSGYLTYWGTNALMAAGECGVLDSAIRDATKDALTATARWAEAEMTRLIACHHAGLLLKFDVVECIATACVAAKLNRYLNPRAVDEVTQLSIHSMSLVIDNYFLGGSFRLSRPVFTDRSRNTILCPTSESLAMLLGSLSARERRALLSQERTEKLLDAFQWCKRNRREHGFPPDFDASLTGLPEVNVFSTASTLALYALLASQLDDAADDAARDALGVGQWVDGDVFPYPDEKLANAISTKIVAPLVKGTSHSPAKYSMILHGPPGTAKTSIAMRVAHDLRWPLKTITQSDFLKSGMDKIDAEADRIFTLCLSLKNVVLLFDELEELILSRDDDGNPGAVPHHRDRESRLLTTSMLPKIHLLRDRKRVVFIFATNRLKQIDSAATRLGRFDMLFGVDYPPVPSLIATAKTALGDATSQLTPDQQKKAQDAFEKWAAGVAGQLTLHITFKDAQYCAERLASDAARNRTVDELLTTVTSAVNNMHDANKAAYDRLQLLKPHDRL